MKLALRELRRRPGRFVSAAAILTLIALLLMFLGGLLDGLVRSSTSAVRAQRGDLIVYSSPAKASFLRSRIEPAQRAVIDATDGVVRSGGIGVVQLGARVPGRGPRELVGVALFGYELAPRGVPEVAPAQGSAYADETLRADGVREGMTIELGPQRTPITIAGFVTDTAYSGQASLWASPQTWRAVAAAGRPDSRVAEGVFQALVVRVDGEPASVGAAIDLATGGATATLTVAEAIEAIPGVKEQRNTFNQIIGVTVAVALAVVALFFALITVERTALYGVLKAVGARSRTLFAGLLVQAAVVTLVAASIAAVAVVVLDRLIPPGGIPLFVSGSRLLLSAALLLVAAAIGCAFSLRRVLRIDPAAAIGSSS